MLHVAIGDYSYFGTLKLQSTLSRKLTAQIHASLPRITQQVGQKLAEIIAKLRELQSLYLCLSV